MISRARPGQSTSHGVAPSTCAAGLAGGARRGRDAPQLPQLPQPQPAQPPAQLAPQPRPLAPQATPELQHEGPLPLLPHDKLVLAPQLYPAPPSWAKDVESLLLEEVESSRKELESSLLEVESSLEPAESSLEAVESSLWEQQ